MDGHGCNGNWLPLQNIFNTGSPFCYNHYRFKFNIMRVRPLLIDKDLTDQIDTLVKYAEKNPITMDYLLDQKNGEEKPPGDYEGYSITLPFGYRIVFTIELQPAGKIRHLSMSVNEDGSLPNEFAVQQIMDLIGFKNPLRQCKIAIENISPTRQAINILEIIK